MLALNGGFTVPGDTVAGRDGTVEVTVFVGASKTVLAEFVAEVSRLEEELEGVDWVADDGVRGRCGLIEEGLGLGALAWPARGIVVNLQARVKRGGSPRLRVPPLVSTMLSHPWGSWVDLEAL